MAFKEWEETEAADALVLPIRGKKYTIPAIGHLDAIRLREEWARVADGEHPTITNDEFMTIILGAELRARMVADNVPDMAIVHAATVAGVDFQQGRDAAEEMWEKGPSPEALAAALKMAAAALDASTTSPDTPPKAPTSSTKPRASSANTTSRKRAPKSPGKTSSRTRASSPRTSSRSTASTSRKPGTGSPGTASKS